MVLNFKLVILSLLYGFKNFIPSVLLWFAYFILLNLSSMVPNDGFHNMPRVGILLSSTKDLHLTYVWKWLKGFEVGTPLDYKVFAKWLPHNLISNYSKPCLSFLVCLIILIHWVLLTPSISMFQITARRLVRHPLTLISDSISGEPRIVREGLMYLVYFV